MANCIGLRVGDHSSSNNRIDYTKSYEEQEKLITYLDSKQNPVGLSKTSNYITTNDNEGITLATDGKTGNFHSTTDYAIANYWTFIPATPTIGNTNISIKSHDAKEVFNLSARVFYDEKNANGKYDQQTDGDHLFSNVILNLYKETADEKAKEGKTYVCVTGSKQGYTIEEVTDFNLTNGQTVYELVKTGVTPLQGTYLFTNLEYDKTKGTKYLYQVIKPNSSLQLTSQNITGQQSIKTESTTMNDSVDEEKKVVDKKTTKTYSYGIYTLYAYDASSYGTEIQTFTVGGDGINLTEQENKTVTTIDVGYQYIRTSFAFNIKKIWKIEDTSIKTPDTAIFEICYNTSKGETKVYEERALSAILSWNQSYYYLETNIDGQEIKDWFVSAEYYIYQDKIFRHQYNYNTDNGIYESFVGDNSYFSLSEYYAKHNEDKADNYQYTMEDIPDFNGDGVSNWDDLRAIQEENSSAENTWKTALPAGFMQKNKEVVAPFNSVLDRNIGTAVTEINITNASKPGIIEILKYTGELSDKNYLDGATFRIYKGTKDSVKKMIDQYNEAQRRLNIATEEDKGKLQEEFNKIAEEISQIQVSSASTRTNGRIAFAGLDPNETYTVRERFAPSGYRILEEYYQVNPKNATQEGDKFDTSNYCLLHIANVEASSNLEIRKVIEGRAWTEDDEFSFDITLNQSNINVTLEDEQLFNHNKQKTEDLVKQFIEFFTKNSKDIVIDKTTKYVESTDSERDANTKVFPGLLESGIPQSNTDTTEKASLLGHEFPVAGTYTFTIEENNEVNDDTIEVSPIRYTISIEVVRTLNAGVNKGNKVTLENSHLEASIYQITYQERLENNNYSQSIVYAGNSPIFVNRYKVEDVEQKIKYTVQKNVIGRENNQWLESDQFSFLLTGKDEQTQEALKNGNITIKGNFLQETKDKFSKSFIICNNTENHQFSFDEIDFNNIEFPVERDENNQPVTKPIVYYLIIKENIPAEAQNNIYQGIHYSSDVYTLKMTLENSINHEESSETDGLIDEITFELYKNKQDGEQTTNEPYSICKINRTKNEKGEIVQTEQHDQRENSHLMVFTNTYENTIKVTKKWEDYNNKYTKRPDSVKVILKGTSINGPQEQKEAILTENNGWEHTFEHVLKYDSKGKQITYVVEEKEVKEQDLLSYKTTIGPIEEIEGQDNHYQVEIKNTLTIPTQVIVHHYIYDVKKEEYTQQRLVADEYIEGLIGQEYSTEPSKEVPQNYVCMNTEPQNSKGKMTEKTIEVNYYYQLQMPTIQDSLKKETKTKVLTKEDGIVEYHIQYDIALQDYIGKVRIELVDYLPAKIDLEKSNIANGQYKEEEQTITWVEEVEINTYQKGEYIAKIEKEIGVVYKDQNLLQDLENKVIGKVTTYTPENPSTSEKEELLEVEKQNSVKTKQEYRTNLQIVKEWEDNEDRQEKRPESITITIVEKPSGTIKTEVLKEANNWQYRINDLPKYDQNGDKITYEVTEQETKEKDLEYYETPQITLIETQTDEVTNYKYKIRNSYRLFDTELNAQIIKKGTEQITTPFDLVTYTINFNAKIADYIGEGKVKIVDTLPYKIDLEKSNLAEGIYDEEEQTITWEEEIPHMNVVDDRQSTEIAIQKEISVLYQGIDLTQEKMTNIVKGKVELYETEQKDEAEAQWDTNIHVNGKVMVRYVEQDTGKDLLKEEIVQKVGTDYTTEAKKIDNYYCVGSTDNTEGKIKEEEQEVIYYYSKLATSVLVKYQDKEGNTLLEDLKIEGKVGDAYQTEQKEIKNYQFVKATNNTSGTMTKEQIVVIYQYEKIPSGVITVKYVDIETQEEITYKEQNELGNTEEKYYSYEIQGFVGEEYQTKEKEIPYYHYVKSTENTEGVLTEAENTIIYYYRKLIFNMKVEKNIGEITINGEKQTLPNNKMIKIELKNPQIETAEIKVTYHITIENIGELAGKVIIQENIPTGYELVETNNDWKENAKGIWQTEVELGAGESKKLTVVLKWVNNSNNLGEKINTVSIQTMQNEANYEDIERENNSSSATVVMSVKTGLFENQIAIGSMILITLATIFIVLEVLILKKYKKEETK